jgi:hypothetical protein
MPGDATPQLWIEELEAYLEEKKRDPDDLS